MNTAIVIARGGSKRIPGKNIKPFADKPVIQYSIEVAREAGIFDRIITSTDSDQIAEVAQAAGAEIPFRRPAELADDHTPTADVLIHAIRWLNRFGSEVRYACGIYPTAPFLRAADLRAGLELLRDSGRGAWHDVRIPDLPGPRARREGRPAHALARLGA